MVARGGIDSGEGEGVGVGEEAAAAGEAMGLGGGEAGSGVFVGGIAVAVAKGVAVCVGSGVGVKVAGSVVEAVVTSCAAISTGAVGVDVVDPQDATNSMSNKMLHKHDFMMDIL